jgi:hypothetical protein
MKLKLSRRDFLKGTAAAAALAAVPSWARTKDHGTGFLETHEMSVGLGTAIPGGLKEVDGKGYSRQPIEFKDGRNKSPIFFPQAESTWGAISHVALFADGGLVAIINMQWRFYSSRQHKR